MLIAKQGNRAMKTAATFAPYFVAAAAGYAIVVTIVLPLVTNFSDAMGAVAAALN